MTKYSKFALIASFMGLWMDSFFSNQIQIFIGFTLIFSLGILHGANDMMLIENVNSNKTPHSYIKLLCYYVLLVLLVALLFYYFPLLALTIFLVISGYHFGEQQWQNLPKYYSSWIRIAFQFSYGSFILLLLFNFHSSEVQRIIFEITSYSVPPNWYQKLLLFFVLVLTVFGIYFYINSKKIRKQLLVELFYLLVFAILFKSSSLIWGFALYFVLWHSIPSIIDQTKFLYGTFDRPNFNRYIKSGLLFWVISLVGLVLLFLLFRSEKIFNALFFSFLAAITFPHVLVIIKMFRRKSGNALQN